MNNTLKNKFKIDYEKQHELPSDHLWERIEEQLIPKEKSVKLNFWKIAAVILLLISIGLLYQYEILPKNVQSNSIVKRTTLTQFTKKSKNDELITNNIYPLESVKPFKTKIDKVAKKISEQKEILVDSEHIPLEVNSGEIKITQNTELVTPKTPMKYITAEDLLFEREVQRTIENKGKTSKMVHVTGFEKPKEISLLGITLYEESK